MENIEEEFMQSWDWVEECYQSLDLPIKNTIIALIQEMRKRGFDKTLKAAKSHYDLIVSNEKHSSIMFIFYEIVSAQKAHIFFNQYKDSFTPEESKEFQDMITRGNSNFIKMILSYNDKRDETISEIKYTPQIESLLQWLEKEEID